MYSLGLVFSNRVSANTELCFFVLFLCVWGAVDVGGGERAPVESEKKF